ncbi:hypothetical protein JTY81_10315 [Citrobacter freundii]|nr:hypothetical protein [Citrobacter freundii]
MKKNKERLNPGTFTKKRFEMFISISSIRSEKSINALRDYFVHGHSRKDTSERNGVSQSYLSLKIKECQMLNYKLNLFLSEIEQENKCLSCEH